MLIVKTLEEAELAFALHFFDAPELIQCVNELIDARTELWNEPELIELVTLNRKQQQQVDRAPILLQAYNTSHPQPPELRPRSLEACGKALLAARLRRYLDGKDEPDIVCEMVDPIEQKFDYPRWLGGLFNICDRLHPMHIETRESWGDMRDMFEPMIRNLEAQAPEEPPSD